MACGGRQERNWHFTLVWKVALSFIGCYWKDGGNITIRATRG